MTVAVGKTVPRPERAWLHPKPICCCKLRTPYQADTHCPGARLLSFPGRSRLKRHGRAPLHPDGDTGDFSAINCTVKGHIRDAWAYAGIARAPGASAIRWHRNACRFHRIRRAAGGIAAMARRDEHPAGGIAGALASC